MVDETYKQYLRSDTWQQLRSKRLAIDEYRCQRCGCPYGLQVHHLFYPETLGTEDPYKDLITLCRPCHEIIEHQKKEYGNDKKAALEEKNKRNLRMIYRTIKQLSCNDLSAIGIGTKDYCNIDVIKADFGPALSECGYEYGYVSRVQNYFRNRRYQIILQMMESGSTPRQICDRTNFSWNMVSKVFNKPETARTILKNEKETEYYD